MSPDALMLCARFAVATVGAGISYFALGSLFYKFEGGLYLGSQVPLPPLDGPHKRARRFFYIALTLVTLVVSLLGLAAYKSIGGTPTWSNLCFPALVGGLFAMLYALVDCRDRVRPRRN